MRIKAIKWNNELFQDQYPFSNKEAKVTLRVTTNMIQNVIEMSGYKSWQIYHCGEEWLSNRNRSVAQMTIVCNIWAMHCLMDNLSLEWIEEDGMYDFYRSHLEKSRGNKLPCALVYSKNKGHQLRRLNYPMNIDGRYYRQDGILYHIVNLKGCYSN